MFSGLVSFVSETIIPRALPDGVSILEDTVFYHFKTFSLIGVSFPNSPADRFLNLSRVFGKILVWNTVNVLGPQTRGLRFD